MAHTVSTTPPTEGEEQRLLAACSRILNPYISLNGNDCQAVAYALKSRLTSPPVAAPTAPVLTEDALIKLITSKIWGCPQESAVRLAQEILTTASAATPAPPTLTKDEIRRALCNANATIACEWPKCSCFGTFKCRMELYTDVMVALIAASQSAPAPTEQEGGE